MIWLARLFMPLVAIRQRGLVDGYAWHKFVWSCFPEQPGAKRDFLTRLDQDEAGARLYLLSLREPAAPDGCEAGWSAKRIASSFLEHEVYRFDLVANPTRKVRRFDSEGRQKKQGRRKAILGGASQEAWLREKGAAGGFILPDGSPLEISPPHAFPFMRRGIWGLHVGVRYRGILRVVDREAFRAAFTDGVGSAKAFGFGLLLLFPVK